MIEPAAAPRPPPPPKRSAGVATRHRRAGIVVSSVDLAVPHLPRRGAGLEDPAARAARGAVVLGEQRQAGVGVVDAAVAPFSLGDFDRLAAERRGERDHLVAERHLVLQIAAVERFRPEHRCRLIGAPAIGTRPGLGAGEADAFTRRLVVDLLRQLSGARPDLDVLREAVHRHGVRERFLDPSDQQILTAGRGRDVGEYRRLADRRLGAGRHVDRGELAGEVVVEQRVVVGGLEEIFVGRRGRRLAVVLLDVRARRHQRLGGRRTASGRHQLADHRRVVLQPVARVAGRGVDVIRAGDDRFRGAGHAVGDPQLDRVVFGLQEGEMRTVGRELDVRDARLRRHFHCRLGAVGDLLQRDRVDAGARQA